MRRLPYVARGDVRFVGAAAERFGVNGMTLREVLAREGGHWGGFRFYEGSEGARRAARQYARYMTQSGGRLSNPGVRIKGVGGRQEE